MHARRLLFVVPNRSARLSPIYAAILLLTSLGLLGFLVASEAGEKDPPHAVQTAPAPAQPAPIMDGLNIPFSDYANRVRRRWM
jgi:hypothetical protein